MAAHIQATLVFNCDQIAPYRRNLCGTWRVHHCSEVANPLSTRVDEIVDRNVPIKVLRLMVDRPYRVGVLVNPAKLAIAYVRSVNGA